MLRFLTLVTLLCWVAGSAMASEGFPSPARLPSGLAFDGSRLLVADRSLYEVDPETGAELARVVLYRADGTTVLSVGNVAYDAPANRLFGCSGLDLIEFDRSTWAVVQEIVLPFRCGGLAWDGTSLIVGDSDSKTVVRMSRSGDVLETVEIDFRLGSLAWDARLQRFYATASSDDLIHVLASDLTEILTYEGPHEEVRGGAGIAIVGTRLFVSYGIEPDLPDPGVIAIVPGVCGDGQLTPGEQCDPGLPAVSDCCTGSCRYAGSLRFLDELYLADALDVSGDGTTLAGTIPHGDIDVAFYWRDADGITRLETQPPGPSFHGGISEDGEVRAVSLGVSGSGTSEFAIWEDSRLLVPDVLPGDLFGIAGGISGDGRVMVGWSGDARVGQERARAVRWTEETGIERLAGVGSEFSSALDVSADGSVVLGRADWVPFLWSGRSQIVQLPQPGGIDKLSADGSTALVLLSEAATIGDAARWTGGAPAPLPVVHEGETPDAEDLSYDGSRVVGSVGGVGLPRSPILWDGDRPVNLRSCAENDGNRPLRPSAISDDGSVIVGKALDLGPPWPSTSMPFILTLPEPDAILAGSAVLLALGLLRRKAPIRARLRVR